MPPRPSNRECEKKVREALQALAEGRCRLAKEKHAAMTFEFLGVTSMAALWPVIEQLLQELLLAGAGLCYCGGRPPARSYDVPGEELWAFVWFSTITAQTTYLKFVLKQSTLLLIDCHESTLS